MTGRTTTSLWDRFAGFDPGLIRLTSALRAVLGTAATLALLTALRAPETALVVGGFTAMTTSLAISDLHPRNQLITLGLGLPLSLACLAVGTALTPYPTAAKLTFLVLICLAVQARRFGPRGLGLGIFGFMAFLLSQFAPARADQLPRLGASVLVAFGAVAIVWCCVGPVTGPGALRRLRHAFDVRLHDVLRDAASMVLATGQDVGTRSRSLQDRLDRLHESVLLIENLLAERAAGRTPRPCGRTSTGWKWQRSAWPYWRSVRCTPRRPATIRRNGRRDNGSHSGSGLSGTNPPWEPLAEPSGVRKGTKATRQTGRPAPHSCWTASLRSTNSPKPCGFSVHAAAREHAGQLRASPPHPPSERSRAGTRTRKA